MNLETTDTENKQTIDLLRSKLEYYPDFPKVGISFVDILPLFRDQRDFNAIISILHARLKGRNIDVVVGLEARGFLFGPSIASALNCSFVPVRKQGKLPGACISAVYTKEYGQDVFEMQEGSIRKGQRCVVVDDLLATGGTAKCASELIKRLGGEIVEYQFIVKLVDLHGEDKINDDGNTSIYSIIDITD